MKEITTTTILVHHQGKEVAKVSVSTSTVEEGPSQPMVQQAERSAMDLMQLIERKKPWGRLKAWRGTTGALIERLGAETVPFMGELGPMAISGKLGSLEGMFPQWVKWRRTGDGHQWVLLAH